MFTIIKKTFAEFIEDDCMSMAAAIAYYTVFSLPSLLIIVVWISSSYFDPGTVREKIGGQFETLIGADAAKSIAVMLENANRPGKGTVATILGLIALLFGATGAVVQLQYSLNRAWEVEPDPKQGGIKNFLIKRLLSLAMVVGIGFLLLVSLLINVAISTFGDRLGQVLWGGGVPASLVQGINTAVTLVIVPLLFAAMFKFLPDAKVAWKEVWLGAFVTMLLFVAGKFAIGQYIGRAEPGSAYGAAGSLAIVLLWIYYSSLVVLLGAEFTQVWSRRHGKRIEPARGAVRVRDSHEHIRTIDTPAGKREVSEPA